MKQPICVIGEGAWGTAIASVLADNGHPVKLWCHDPHVAVDIKKVRENVRYMPGVRLSSAIEPTHDLEQALADVAWVFFSTPVPFARAVLERAKPFYKPHQTWVMLNKGVEYRTSMLPTHIFHDVIGDSAHSLALSGPSFARDVLNKQLTGLVVASADDDECHAGVKELLENEYIQITESDDVIGVQLCGALKNVIAVGVGLLDGSGYSENTKALFVTRAFQEMVHIVSVSGGHAGTAMGLAGVGDIVLTAYSTQGRNLAVGKVVGKGGTLAEWLTEHGTLPEGVNTLKSVYHLVQEDEIALPIFTALYHVVIDGEPVSELLDALR
jgi:glycerol-3-phosphate dehydrogenase (NAD(P)+)